MKTEEIRNAKGVVEEELSYLQNISEKLNCLLQLAILDSDFFLKSC